LSNNIDIIKTQQQVQKQTGHKLYNKFYWCDFCHKWIEQVKAKWKEAKIRKYPVCPNPSCNGNRLKTQSTNYKYKNKEDAERRRKTEY